MTEDVVALSDQELLKRYYGALQAIPRISEGPPRGAATRLG